MNTDELFIISKSMVKLYFLSFGEICNIKHLHNFESVILAKLT